MSKVLNCGACGLYIGKDEQDINGYHRPELCAANDEIIDTINNDKKRKAMWKDSYEYIESELLLSKVNKKRSEIIEKLIN
jgi:hypothetical protein